MKCVIYCDITEFSGRATGKPRVKKNTLQASHISQNHSAASSPSLYSISTPKMVGRAKSDSLKKIEFSWTKTTLQAKAVEAYRAKVEKVAQGLKSKSSRTICNEVMAEYTRETGKHIQLNHGTIINHVAGKTTRAEVNSNRSWLATEETKVVIAFIVEVGLQGFGLSHRRLKEHVDEILRGKLGDDFREEGVGKKWTHRFVERKNDHIQMAWTTALEEKRGQAVNPNTAAA